MSAQSLTVSVWPAIGVSVPFPTAVDSPLPTTGATLTTTDPEVINYVTGLISSGLALTEDPLNAGAPPAVSYPATSNAFNVVVYGADPYGGADSAPAIQAAIAAASLYALTFGTSAVVSFPAGRFLVGAILSVTQSGVRLVGAGKGQTVIVSTMTGATTGYVVHFAGTLTATLAGALTSLAADAGPVPATPDNGKLVTLTSVAGITTGAVLLIGDTYNDGMSAQGWANRYRGEFVTVASIAGNVVTLTAPLRDAYTVARTASAWLPSFVTNVGITGVTITSAAGVQGNSRIGGVQFSVCHGVTVADYEACYLDNAGVILDSTVSSILTGLSIHDLTDSTSNSRFGYGVAVLASEGTIIADSEFRRTRHGVTTGATNNAFGWCRNVLVANCSSVESFNSSFDTHPATTDVVFTGCRSDLSAFHGFCIRSQRTRVTDNDVSRCKFDGVTMQLGQAIDVEIANNRVFEASRYGIGFLGDATDGNPSNINLHGNYVLRPYQFGLRIEYAITGLRCVDNQFIDASQNAPTTGASISVNVALGALDGAVFAGNLGTGVQAVITATGGVVTNSKFFGNRGCLLVGATPAVVRGSVITAGSGNTVNASLTDSTLDTSTFTAALATITGLGIGTAPFAGRAVTILQSTAGQVVRLTRTTTSDTSVAFSVVLGEAIGAAFGGNVSGDAVSRWVFRASGKLEIGDGTNPVDTSLYRSASDTLATDDDFAISLAGKGLRVKEGSNAKAGVTTLASGSVVVSTTAVTATSRIQLTGQSDGGTPGWLRVSARTAGTSFTISSSSGTDSSTVAWLIVEPA